MSSSGAYWNNEKDTGELYINKRDTDYNYDNTISYLYDKKMKKNSIILATHNSLSINTGIFYNQTMLNKSNQFEFGHLLGMKEKKYNNISDGKINVYIPYGPYYKMIPYLLRRLYENIDTIKYLK